MSKPYPADILDQMRVAIASWQTINPNLKFRDLSVDVMQATLERGEALRHQINALEAQLTDLRNQRDEVYHIGWKSINRLRDGIMGFYGDDSSEYEMVGRTRRSERKPRSKRARVSEAEPAAGDV